MFMVENTVRFFLRASTMLEKILCSLSLVYDFRRYRPHTENNLVGVKLTGTKTITGATQRDSFPSSDLPPECDIPHVGQRSKGIWDRFGLAQL